MKIDSGINLTHHRHIRQSEIDKAVTLLENNKVDYADPGTYDNIDVRSNWRKFADFFSFCFQKGNSNEVVKALALLQKEANYLDSHPEESCHCDTAVEISNTFVENAKLLHDNMNPQDQCLFHASVNKQTNASGMEERIASIKIAGQELVSLHFQTATRDQQLDNAKAILSDCQKFIEQLPEENRREYVHLWTPDADENRDPNISFRTNDHDDDTFCLTLNRIQDVEESFRYAGDIRFTAGETGSARRRNEQNPFGHDNFTHSGSDNDSIDPVKLHQEKRHTPVYRSDGLGADIRRATADLRPPINPDSIVRTANGSHISYHYSGHAVAVRLLHEAELRQDPERVLQQMSQQGQRAAIAVTNAINRLKIAIDEGQIEAPPENIRLSQINQLIGMVDAYMTKVDATLGNEIKTAIRPYVATAAEPFDNRDEEMADLNLLPLLDFSQTLPSVDAAAWELMLEVLGIPDENYPELTDDLYPTALQDNEMPIMPNHMPDTLLIPGADQLNISEQEQLANRADHERFSHQLLDRFLAPENTRQAHHELRNLMNGVASDIGDQANLGSYSTFMKLKSLALPEDQDKFTCTLRTTPKANHKNGKITTVDYYISGEKICSDSLSHLLYSLKYSPSEGSGALISRDPGSVAYNYCLNHIDEFNQLMKNVEGKPIDLTLNENGRLDTDPANATIQYYYGFSETGKSLNQMIESLNIGFQDVQWAAFDSLKNPFQGSVIPQGITSDQIGKQKFMTAMDQGIVSNIYNQSIDRPIMQAWQKCIEAFPDKEGKSNGLISLSGLARNLYSNEPEAQVQVLDLFNKMISKAHPGDDTRFSLEMVNGKPVVYFDNEILFT